ncbi:myotubularin-related protein 13-like, partial [Tropilaelaps mercedesae]
MEQCHSDGLQLRSHSFELMKIAIDLEASVETIEALRQHWHTVSLFALSKGQIPVVPKLKEKHHTLRFKKRIIQTAVKAGLSKGRNYAATLTQTLPSDRTILAALPDDGPFSMAPWEATLSKDYQRLMLTGHNGLLSIGHVHTLCKSYPPLVVVPSSANSDRLQK